MVLKSGFSTVLWPWGLLTSFIHLMSIAAVVPLTILASLTHFTFVFTMLSYTLLNNGLRSPGSSSTITLASNGQLKGKHLHNVADERNSKGRRQFFIVQQLKRMATYVWSVPRGAFAATCSVTRHGLSRATNLAFYYPVVVPTQAAWSVTTTVVTTLRGYLWPGPPHQQLVVREAQPEDMQSVAKMLETDREKRHLPAQLHVLSSPGSLAAMFLIGGIINNLLHSELVAILAAFPVWVGVVQARLCFYWTQEQARRDYDHERRLCRYLVAVYKNRVQGVVRLTSLGDDVPVIREIAWVENVRFDVSGELLRCVQSYSSKGEVRATLSELETEKLELLAAHGFRLTRKWAALDIFPGIELENCDMSKDFTS